MDIGRAPSGLGDGNAVRGHFGIAGGVVARWLEVIRLICEQPGLTMTELRQALPDNPSPATLYRDLARLKAAGILEDARHRKGYVLKGASFPKVELRVLLNGLQIQAQNMRHPVDLATNERLLQRLGRVYGDLRELTYPVRSVANRVIVETQSEAFHTLIETLEECILAGRHVTVRQLRDPYRNRRSPNLSGFPLQLIYHDIAWYLLMDVGEGFHLVRIDRLSPAITAASEQARTLTQQRERLQAAQRLMLHSWDMVIPPDDGRLVRCVVQFDAYAASFMVEGVRRHPNGSFAADDTGGTFVVDLHPVAVRRFGIWVQSWGYHAWVVEPVDLQQALVADARQLVAMAERIESR